jgi:hypothetical protein
MVIPPVVSDVHIPEGTACQEASPYSRLCYIPCGERAVTIVYHAMDRRSYYMCAACADHNVRHRGAKLVYSTEPISRTANALKTRGK